MTGVTRARWLPGQRPPGSDRGAFAVLELIICTTFVIVMMLLIVGFGRVSRGRQLVDQAATAASRAGSLSGTPGAATDAALRAATQTLASGGLSCASMQISLDVSQFHPGGQVVAHVTCEADLSGLAMAGVPGVVRLTADSISPLDSYRDLSGGGG